MKGEYAEQVSTGVDVYSIKQPVGVVGIISPFNFPAMVPLWFFPLAIAAGNTVVLKPSEKDPSASIWLAELLTECGLPNGVLNVVNGDKESVDALLDNPDVAAISFVGSTPIAKYIYERGTANGKRVQALGGAKNHMLVLPDADLDLVADSAVNAGFGSAGERCMAISVVVAVEPVADALIEKIQSRMATLKVGDGTRNCDMGPLITDVHRDKVASYLEIAEQDGAEIVVDGRGIEVDGDPNGFWLGPTLIDKVPTSSKVYTEEIFGPVLSVVRVKSYDEGLALINGSQYGNGTAIFTNDGGAARRFQSEVTVGMVGINVPLPPPGRLLLVRRLEGLAVRRHEGLRHAGDPLLHAREGDHLALARPEPRRHQPGLPAELADEPERREPQIWGSRALSCCFEAAVSGSICGRRRGCAESHRRAAKV